MYLWVPSCVLSKVKSSKATTPALVLVLVWRVLPSASFNTNVNSPSFNSRPARALLKSNLVLTGATAKLLNSVSAGIVTLAVKTPDAASFVTLTVTTAFIES